MLTNYSTQKRLYDTKFSVYASAYLNDDVVLKMKELNFFNIEGIHTFVFEIEKVKKPTNAYQQFIKDNRQKVKDENPGLSNEDYFRLLASNWQKHKDAMKDNKDSDLSTEEKDKEEEKEEEKKEDKEEEKSEITVEKEDKKKDKKGNKEKKGKKEGL